MHVKNMIYADFYVYINFYCIHSFCRIPRMLLYDGYRRLDIPDGLIEDKGHQSRGFADIAKERLWATLGVCH
jgi:hypothetical protein